MSASERQIDALKEEVHRLRRLLSQQMRTGETLEVSAIVNQDGEPLLDLRWDQLAAQMKPDALRELAFDMLRACEWAETDAIMFKVLREQFDDRTAGGFMALMREGRGSERERSA